MATVLFLLAAILFLTAEQRLMESELKRSQERFRDELLGDNPDDDRS